MLTLLCVIVGWLIVFYFLVIFLSSKYDTPADTTVMWSPFLQLYSLAQQLYILGLPFGTGSSGGIINCDNLFFMIGARGGVEMSGYGRWEAA